MATLKTQRLPYYADSSQLFSALATEPWAQWLDSGHHTHGSETSRSSGSRYDLLVARPFITMLTYGAKSQIHQDGCTRHSDLPPLTLLRELLLPYSTMAPSPYPFTGGALGYLGYELEIPTHTSTHPRTLPDLAIGIYDWVVVVDHSQQHTTLLSYQHHPSTLKAWPALIALFSQPKKLPSLTPLRATGQLHESLGEIAHHHAVERIQRYLHAGDCYQVNLTQQFSVQVEGDPYQGYLDIRAQHCAPFSAYLCLEDGNVVMSFSPERFIQLQDHNVTTAPIKGTRPRGSTPIEDQRLLAELQQSLKDRAENIMIVDLLRNDLGHCCIPGSIRVPLLCQIESHPNVHHLVSTICGKLRPDMDGIALLEAAFPGGSITGAPKIRAMQIIQELEHCARSIYCGSIGYIGFNGNIDTNIAIRTAYTHQGRLNFHAGGGIIFDSVASEEYQELLHKARFFLDYLQLTPL